MGIYLRVVSRSSISFWGGGGGGGGGGMGGGWSEGDMGYLSARSKCFIVVVQ